MSPAKLSKFSSIAICSAVFSGVAQRSLPAFSANSLIAAITDCCASKPNLTAPNTVASSSSPISDSTINTPSFVAATTKSISESSTAFFEGFKIYWPSAKPTRAAPIGPWNGTPDSANAADDAIIAKISG